MAFYSRQLHDAETRYSATEIECLAVGKAVRHFEVYLDGRHFRLQTDHRALEHLLTAKLQNWRLSRWALRLQDFSFSIQYWTGKVNGNTDGLSRQAWFPDDEVEVVRAEQNDLPDAKCGIMLAKEGCGTKPT